MKYIKKTLTIALCLAFALGFMMASGLSMQKAYAADYKYKIKVYSGKEGYFGDEDTHERSVDVAYGDEIKIVTNDGIYVNNEKKADLKTTLLDDKTYYLKGVKESGHDNKEYLQSSTFIATGDTSFSSVYGMAGGMVKYVINYVDEEGAALASSETFYGMVDDKPVVSFKHIEGYVPNAYNLGMTLSSNEAENVFTFTYSENTGGTTTVIVNGGNGAGGAGADGVNIGDNETPTAGPADYVDLDDNQTPTTDGTDIDDSKSPGVNWPIIGGGAVIVAAIAAAAVALSRRRRSEEE